MEGRIVFLLEEPSMQLLLEGWLPRLFPGLEQQQHFLCVPHEGKSDLDRSVPRKLAAWRYPNDRFVIVRDNDGADCVAVKARILASCPPSRHPVLVRLVCQELEGWYLGGLPQLATAFDNPKLASPALRHRFRDPDTCAKPSLEIKRLVPTFQKLQGARAMARHIDPVENRSPSLRVFVEGVTRLAQAMGYQRCASAL